MSNYRVSGVVAGAYIGRSNSPLTHAWALEPTRVPGTRKQREANDALCLTVQNNSHAGERLDDSAITCERCKRAVAAIRKASTT